MIVNVTANQKGGVGKTATNVHLSFGLYERGEKHVVVDLDTQANSSYTLGAFKSELTASHLFSGDIDGLRAWFAENPTEDGPMLIAADDALKDVDDGMDIITAATNFRASIAVLAEQGFKVCLIDTSPHLGKVMIAALAAADYVLSPIEVEIYSIIGIDKMLAILDNVKAGSWPGIPANPGMKFVGMVPCKINSSDPRHIENIKLLNESYPELIVPLQVGLRSSIAEALSIGVPVWQIKKTAARKAIAEVRAINEYVFSEIGI